MEGFFLLKKLLENNDYMCKLDLKEAHLLVPLKSRWRDWLYQLTAFDLSCLLLQ